MPASTATFRNLSVDLPSMKEEPKEQLNVRVPVSLKKRLWAWIDSQTFPPQPGDVVSRALSDLLDKLEAGELGSPARPKKGAR